MSVEAKKSFLCACLLAALLAPSVFSAPIEWAANAGGKVAFYADGKGKVTAVEIGRGDQTRWTSEVAGQVLAANQGAVAVLVAGPEGHQITVALLDEKTGKELRRTEAIDLPDWATASPRYEVRFEASGRVSDKEIVLEWRAHTVYARGVPPREPFKPKTAAGALAVAVQTARVRKLADPEAPKGPGSTTAPKTKAGTVELTWRLLDERKRGPGSYYLRSRSLTAVDAKSGRELWSRPMNPLVEWIPRPAARPR